MSTIAYKDGQWRYDTRVTRDIYVDSDVEKAFTTNVHSLSIGVVGDLAALTKLRYATYPNTNEYNYSDANRYVLGTLAPFISDLLGDDDAGVMIVYEGIIYEGAGDGGFYPVGTTYHAVGSGDKAALAVMYSGGGPQEAVEMAHRFDVYTGSTIGGFNV